MNEQPPEIMSQIIAVVFAIVAFLTYLFGRAKPINLDNFEIGYISENPVPVRTQIIARPEFIPQVKVAPVSSPKPPKPKPLTPKVVKPKTQVSPLQQDCIDVLRAMGMKKSESVSKMNQIFNYKNPKTVQEFISEAFKRENN